MPLEEIHSDEAVNTKAFVEVVAENFAVLASQPDGSHEVYLQTVAFLRTIDTKESAPPNGHPRAIAEFIDYGGTYDCDG